MTQSDQRFICIHPSDLPLTRSPLSARSSLGHYLSLSTPPLPVTQREIGDSLGYETESLRSTQHKRLRVAQRILAISQISALKPLLTPSFIKNRIFTLDAMHTQTELCAKIDHFGGAYVLVAKDNQPTLREDLSLFFDAPPFDWCWQQAQTWDKAHGRLEHHHIICSPDLNAWFAKRWRGVAQVFRLQRTTTLLKTGKVRKQTVYGISNLSVSKAPALRMLALNRGHWGIENRLHWRRDVTLGEDGCQTRTGVAPAILACLNSAILSLMDRLGVSNVARQARFFDAYLDQAVQALLSGTCSVY